MLMRNDNDHIDHDVDDPFDHAREPMSMDYEDDYDGEQGHHHHLMRESVFHFLVHH